jgi:hypothetical protein
MQYEDITDEYLEAYFFFCTKRKPALKGKHFSLLDNINGKKWGNLIKD